MILYTGPRPRQGIQQNFMQILEKMIDKNKKVWRISCMKLVGLQEYYIKPPCPGYAIFVSHWRSSHTPRSAISIFKITVYKLITKETNAKLWLVELETLMKTNSLSSKIWSSTNVQHLQQTRSVIFIQKGDLVLAIQSPWITGETKGKLEGNWEGPFMVGNVFSKKTFLLIMEGHG